MNAVEIIEKKRDGRALSTEEIRAFVAAYSQGDIPDYQAAAWCMAVYFQGMSARETADLTLAIARSGDMLDLSDVLGYSVDKHSSGGVGDKTSLVVLPLVAAAGIAVAKMSGRGLSFTGGTLDKLESIPGFTVDLSEEQFLAQAAKVGIVLAGQTRDLAPADGKLYALRDVTGTVPSKPLIASSIMSKKIAAGADAILLDVKVGRGAFMETVEAAQDLARMMVSIGANLGRDVTALLSDMNQPLGQAIGNALEVREAIDTLHGGGPERFVEHCLTVAAHMVRMGRQQPGTTIGGIRTELENRLANAEAFDKFVTLIRAQGGDVGYVEDPSMLPTAPVIREVPAPRDGYLAAVDAREVGLTALDLGAGRHKKGDPVDHAVGVIIGYRVGDRVPEGDTLFTVHARTEDAAAAATQRLLAAHTWSDEPVEPLPMFYDVITGNGTDQ